MVKLASARESRLYGPRLVKNRSEYMNAGLYVFATVVLLMGFVAQLSREPKSGLVILLIGLGLMIGVNLHDLVAHLAGIDYRLGLMEYDTQLALVEFGVPLVQSLGSLLSFLGILFLFILEEKGVGYKLETHALNLIVAGPILWLIGSIHNACQIYERADGHVQILQESVHIPFLLGSLLFVVGAAINRSNHSGWFDRHGLMLLSKTWTWLGMFGSILLFIGGIMNVVKVFKMQQIDGLRLEKLRGGAQERLVREREGQVPLIIEENISSRKRQQVPETRLNVGPTPYKDVLVGNN
ncbi:hypothetical protein RND81_12G104900 [Saponaria officinalis]|uniref:Uncharacterized protein n=1 Tax=Saponaria officinalis TaxID=3572 RepID=A0AAW1H906_SAPOF